MPGVDGLEATQRIRAAEWGSDSAILIIAMTASAMSGDRERCLEAGMNGYIAKPIVAADLMAMISQVTAGHVPVGLAS